jgi:hypothetical protein
MDSMDECFGSVDILTEILLHLPVKSLFDFKSVSKNWYAIISASYFGELYRKKVKEEDQQLLGFLVTESKHQFLPTFALLNMSSKSDKRLGCCSDYCSYIGCLKCFPLIGCSNGMLLFGNHGKGTYFAWNPIGKHHISFHTLGNPHPVVAMGFHFDPIKNEFVLIRAGLALIPQPYTNYSSTSHMEIFSSAISIWEKCVPTDLDFFF